MSSSMGCTPQGSLDLFRRILMQCSPRPVLSGREARTASPDRLATHDVSEGSAADLTDSKI